jgi:succinate-acetate transporter protein
MFLGTLRLNGSLMFVFGTLFILFFLLSANASAILNTGGNSDLLKFTGYEGVLCGLSAMYASMATVLNEVYRKTVLPTFPVKPKS